LADEKAGEIARAKGWVLPSLQSKNGCHMPMKEATNGKMLHKFAGAASCSAIVRKT